MAAAVVSRFKDPALDPSRQQSLFSETATTNCMNAMQLGNVIEWLPPRQLVKRQLYISAATAAVPNLSSFLKPNVILYIVSNNKNANDFLL